LKGKTAPGRPLLAVGPGVWREVFYSPNRRAALP
jgi:hypothetical protein